MNYWFWLYMAAVPLIVFSIRPTASGKIRVALLLFAVLLCYGLMNLSVDKKWELKGEAYNQLENPTEEDTHTVIADGANRAFTLFFGWVPSSILVFFWWQMRRFYHYKKIVRPGTDRGVVRGAAVLSLRLARALFTLMAGLLVLTLLFMEFAEMMRRLPSL